MEIIFTNDHFYDEFTDGRINPNARLVFFCLLQFRKQEDDGCCISQQRIVELSGLSYNTVKSAIETLQKHGFISRKTRERGNFATYYTFPLISSVANGANVDNTP